MNKLKFSMVALLSATMLSACSLPESLTGVLPGMSKSTSETPTSTEKNPLSQRTIQVPTRLNLGNK